MEIAVISDAISSIAYSAQTSGFSNFFLNRSHNVLPVTDASSDQPTQSQQSFHVSALSRPATRTMTKPRIRKNRRVKRKIMVDDGGEEIGFFLCGDGGDYNNGGRYFGSGGGWNFGGHGWANWGEPSDDSISDPAFDFVYEVLCWIAMSNCLHFACKRVARFVSDGFGDRGKVPMQLPAVC